LAAETGGEPRKPSTGGFAGGKRRWPVAEEGMLLKNDLEISQEGRMLLGPKRFAAAC
jgi:hypothetical protein